MIVCLPRMVTMVKILRIDKLVHLREIKLV